MLFLSDVVIIFKDPTRIKDNTVSLLTDNRLFAVAG